MVEKRVIKDKWLIQYRDKVEDAIVLRSEGMIYKDIRKKLDIDITTTRLKYKMSKVIKETCALSLKDMKDDIHTKYIQMFLPLEDKLDDRSTDKKIKILKEIRDLCGLDAPKKIQLDVDIDPREVFEIQIGRSALSEIM